MNPGVYLYDLELRRQFGRWLETQEKQYQWNLLENADLLNSELTAYHESDLLSDRDKLRALSQPNLGVKACYVPMITEDVRNDMQDVLELLEKRAYGTEHQAAEPPLEEPAADKLPLLLAKRIKEDFYQAIHLPFRALPGKEIVRRCGAYALADCIRHDLCEAITEGRVAERAMRELYHLQQPFSSFYRMAVADDPIETLYTGETAGTMESFFADPRELELRHQETLERMSDEQRLVFRFQERIRETFVEDEKILLKREPQELVQDSLAIGALRNAYAVLSQSGNDPVWMELLLATEDPLKEVADVYESRLRNNLPVSVTDAAAAVAQTQLGTRSQDRGLTGAGPSM